MANARPMDAATDSGLCSAPPRANRDGHDFTCNVARRRSDERSAHAIFGKSYVALRRERLCIGVGKVARARKQLSCISQAVRSAGSVRRVAEADGENEEFRVVVEPHVIVEGAHDTMGFSEGRMLDRRTAPVSLSAHRGEGEAAIVG